MGRGVGTSEEFPKIESQSLLHCLVGRAFHGPFLVTFQDLLKDQGKLRGRGRGWLRYTLGPILKCKKVLRRGGARGVIPE